MDKNIYIYILIMGAVSYLIRALPMTLMRKPVKNVFVKSFLYYVPYVTLAVMTFPAIINSTQSVISGILALAVGIITASLGLNLIAVSASCCVTVFIAELVIFAVGS